MYFTHLTSFFIVALLCVIGAHRVDGLPEDITGSSLLPFADGDGHGGQGIHYVPQGRDHSHTLIFLHGYNDVDEYLPRTLINLSSFPKHNWKIIMPFGQVLDQNDSKGWASVPTPQKIKTANAKEDEIRFRLSSKRIMRIIDAEDTLHGIPSTNIAIGGFSQGGALAYLTALEYHKPILGLFGISCWVPLMRIMFRPEESWPTTAINITAAASTLKVLHLHGKSDRVILPLWGKVSAEFLRSNGIEVQFHLFEVDHKISDQEVTAVAGYLTRQIKTAKLLKTVGKHIFSSSQSKPSKSEILEASKRIVSKMLKVMDEN